jgi:hypothetical protein
VALPGRYVGSNVGDAVGAAVGAKGVAATGAIGNEAGVNPWTFYIIWLRLI